MIYYYFMEIYQNEFSPRAGKVVERCQTYHFTDRRKLVAAYKSAIGYNKSRLNRIEIYGPAATEFLDTALPGDVRALGDAEYQPTWVLAGDGVPFSRAILHRLYGEAYHLHVEQQTPPIFRGS